MDASASLMNDTAKTNYTYVAQLPYLKMALTELQEEYELNNIPITEKTSSVIQVDAGQTEIIYNGGGLPTLPDDMVEPAQLWERTRNIDPFIPMTKRDYLPHYLAGTLTNQFIYYVWNQQKIQFLAANQNNDIKIDYIRELFTNIVNEGSAINVINALSFLEYRTASLCSEFIARDKPTADSLNAYAVLGMERATGISVKGKQNIMTRRRPFRSAYKRRGW